MTQLTIVALVFCIVAMAAVVGGGIRDRDPITITIGLLVGPCASFALVVLT